MNHLKERKQLHSMKYNNHKLIYTYHIHSIRANIHILSLNYSLTKLGFIIFKFLLRSKSLMEALQNVLPVWSTSRVHTVNRLCNNHPILSVHTTTSPTLLLHPLGIEKSKCLFIIDTPIQVNFIESAKNRPIIPTELILLIKLVTSLTFNEKPMGHLKERKKQFVFKVMHQWNMPISIQCSKKSIQ